MDSLLSARTKRILENAKNNNLSKVEESSLVEDMFQIELSDPGKLKFLKDSNFYTIYAHDILQTLYDDEKIVFKGAFRNHQLDLRINLINFMRSFAKKHRYALTTVHLAVLFLDIYMDGYVLSEIAEHQKFVSLVTLLLAAKSEDLDDKVPSIKDLLKVVNLSDEMGLDWRFRNQYPPAEVQNAYKQYLTLYTTLEYLIFEAINFCTIRPTPIHFLNIFQKVIVTEEDLQDIDESDEGGASGGHQRIQSFGDLNICATEHLRFLSDILLYNIEFYHFLPSKNAAAIIACTRKLLNIKHYWNVQLEFLTHATFEELQPIICLFLEKRSFIIASACELNMIFNQSFEEFRDSGYHDDSAIDDSISSNSSQTDDEEVRHKNKKFKTANYF